MRITRAVISVIAGFFLFRLNTLAQVPVQSSDLILFRGVVIGSSSNERLSGSQIFINRSFTTSSRPDGTFSFFANKRDTVVFTMLGYRPEMLVISDTLKAREFLTGVYLKTDTIEIGEVIILPRVPNLRADVMYSKKPADQKIENAKSNIDIASYVGRTSESKLGDPSMNYGYIMNKQRNYAIEKGGIPADQIAGINPFIFIPAAYMLLHGKPDAPPPPEPRISQKDLDELNRIFLETRKDKR